MNLPKGLQGHSGNSKNGQGKSKKLVTNTIADKTSCPKLATVSDIVALWIKKLRQLNIPEPEESVHLIMAHAHGKKMIHEVDLHQVLADDVVQNVNRMCEQRLERWPVQYIIGEWDFHDMTLEMRPPVLIPRPETEELVDIVIKDWNERKQTFGHFLDIGCGSGAISLYLLKALKNVKCVAIDSNPKACQLTYDNACTHILTDQLQIIHGDIFEESTISKLKSYGPYDIIVSNPPYLTSAEMCNLQKEIMDFEDHCALHGGLDGLSIVQQILSVSPNLLKPIDGLMWLEIGPSHHSLINRLVKEHPEYKLKYIQTFKDFLKRDRFCKLQAMPG